MARKTGAVAINLKEEGYINKPREVTRDFVQDLLDPEGKFKIPQAHLLYFHMNYNWDTERLATCKRDYQRIEKELQETFHLYKLKGTKHKVFREETDEEPAHIQCNVSQGEYVAYIPGNDSATVNQLKREISEHLKNCETKPNKLMPTEVYFLVSTAFYCGKETKEL